jgi:hypothetical protein
MTMMKLRHFVAAARVVGGRKGLQACPQLLQLSVLQLPQSLLPQPQFLQLELPQPLLLQLPQLLLLWMQLKKQLFHQQLLPQPLLQQPQLQQPLLQELLLPHLPQPSL